MRLTRLLTDRLDLDPLAEVVFARSFHAQVPFTLLSHLAEGKPKGFLSYIFQNPFFPCA